MKERLHTRLMAYLSKQRQSRDAFSLITDISLTMAKEIDAIEGRVHVLETNRKASDSG